MNRITWDVLRWDPGLFTPFLFISHYGRYTDYCLKVCPEVRMDGCETYAGPLPARAKEQYLPVFQKMSPGFTMEQMKDVHCCEYTWYDGTDALYCY